MLLGISAALLSILSPTYFSLFPTLWGSTSQKSPGIRYSLALLLS